MKRFAACFLDGRRAGICRAPGSRFGGTTRVGIALGYEDVSDNDELRHNPVMAALADKLRARRVDRAPVAGKSTLNRLELSRDRVTRFLVTHKTPPKEIILDLDATDDPLHGRQEGRFFHGYYDRYRYLPLPSAAIICWRRTSGPARRDARKHAGSAGRILSSSLHASSSLVVAPTWGAATLHVRNCELTHPKPCGSKSRQKPQRFVVGTENAQASPKALILRNATEQMLCRRQFPIAAREDFTTFEGNALAEERIDDSPGRSLQIAIFARQRLWRAITARSVLPKSQRDVRLDLFRGLANWLIFLGHIPGSVLAWFTTRNYGFSDGADLFVLISGYTATFVFGKNMLEHGFVIGATRILRRVWQLYVAHLLLFLFYLTAVHYLSHRFDDPHFMDQFNVATLMDRPVETLSEGLLLKFKPLNLDVLPLYIVLMAAFPVVLWLMLRWRNVMMLGSVGLYLAARHYGWNFPSYPAGVWYFNPFAWQLLFFVGAWLALGGTETTGRILRSRWLYLPCAAFLVIAFGITLAERIPGLLELIPGQLAEQFIPNDKTNLAPYRVVHLASLAFIVVSLIPIDWPGLRWPVFRPLIRCGQQSLPVFCVGLFLSFIAHFIFEFGSANVLIQLLVGAAGLWIMTLIAYYRTWSKQVDKNLTTERSTRAGGE